MINILPEQQKKSVRSSYVIRIVVVVGFLITGVLVIGLLLLVPAYLIISQELSTVNDLTAGVIARNRILEAEQAILVVKSTESLIERARIKRTLAPSVTEAVKAIVDRMNPRISLRTIDVGGGSVRLTGIARDRQSLLLFVADLEKEKARFASVNSPITNLIRDKDLSFQLTLNEAR